jgi:outer membrane protein assembly factor BamB
MVFIGTVDGRGIALDQKTGAEKWQVRLPTSPIATAATSPRAGRGG